MFFQDIDTPEKAYWLGFIYADGNNLQHSKTTGKVLWRVTIALQLSDGYHLEKLRNSIFPDKDAPVKYVEKTNKSRLSITNKRISKDLNKHGVIPNKSLVIKLPKKGTLSENLFLYFVQGLFDGDGSLSFTKKTKTPCACLDFSGSVSLINDLKPILETLSGVRFGYKERTSVNTIATCYIKGNNVVLKFLNWLYSDPTYILKRKYDRYQTLIKLTQKISSKKTSKYRGVYFRRGQPHSVIQKGNNVYRLGRFESEEYAAKAYNEKAIELFGSRAILNTFL